MIRLFIIPFIRLEVCQINHLYLPSFYYTRALTQFDIEQWRAKERQN